MICEKMSMVYREEETIQYLQPLEDILKNKLKTKTTNKTNSTTTMSDCSNRYKNRSTKKVIQKLENVEIELVRDLVIKCLSKDRAEEYHKWLHVGLCLHNINSNEAYLELWKRFSQKSSDYDETSCDQKWKSFRSNHDGSPLTYRSLRWWAKSDNPKEFKQIIQDSLKE